MPAIRVRDLRKSYGRIEAVRGVDFDVAEGEIFSFLGPNGAGKTTRRRASGRCASASASCSRRRSPDR